VTSVDLRTSRNAMPTCARRTSSRRTSHTWITFKSTRVEEKGKERLAVTGDLTIRGTTRVGRARRELGHRGERPVGKRARWFHRRDEESTARTSGWLQTRCWITAGLAARTRSGHHDRDSKPRPPQRGQIPSRRGRGASETRRVLSAVGLPRWCQSGRSEPKQRRTRKER